ncbi:MAG: exosortase system-associated protein, TIGR04073 family [Nitrospiraceae bacterium]|nr:exosortase system-associated protein, TIGR04073 family [Nitrospiraceae bacterium]
MSVAFLSEDGMKLLLVGLVIMIGYGSFTSAYAEEQSIPIAIGTKLTRGVVNLATGWIELPKQIVVVGHEKGWAAGVFRGSIDGLGMGLARTLAGAYEILSFPLPLPPRYQPMLLPDYVWQAEMPEVSAEQFEHTREDQG